MVEEKSDEGTAGAARLVDLHGLDWSCRLKEVQRIEADPEDDDMDDLFSVSFAADGLNAESEVEIMVPDAADVEVVAVALDALHGALLAWTELIARRKAEMKAIVAEE